MLTAGFPPDITASPPTAANIYSPVLGSFWETHLNNYWDVTTCTFAQEIDPAWDGAPEAYDYAARLGPFRLAAAIRPIATGGGLRRPLVTVHGTMDALLPIKTHARPFRSAVEATGRGDLHRLYEIQNGGHIEKHRQSGYNFVQLEYIQPHAHRAFELLVDWVEEREAPPPGQCVPRGGVIVADPAGAGRLEHCAALLVE